MRVLLRGETGSGGEEEGETDARQSVSSTFTAGADTVTGGNLVAGLELLQEQVELRPRLLCLCCYFTVPAIVSLLPLYYPFTVSFHCLFIVLFFDEFLPVAA